MRRQYYRCIIAALQCNEGRERKENEEEEEERAEEDQGELLFAKAVFLGNFSCVGSVRGLLDRN